VTIVRFTSDGKRLISCGGDKNMVFNSVHGPTISKLKSIATPNGSINGFAVEASNKFAVTSGQDKRLNVWNVQSGKHMRAYRSEHIHSELYKSDIDPSGK
jgi:WD40 repeat protein